MAAHTLTLDNEISRKIEETVSPYGGKVPNYVRKIIEDLWTLDARDRAEVQQLIALKLKRRAEVNGQQPPENIGAEPAIPIR